MDDLIEKWIAGTQAKIEKYHLERNYTFPSGRLTVQKGKSYAKIILTQSNGAGGSAFAFIALKDNVTRGMGQVKKGDVFKPASWASPAKHARGNLFDASKGLDQVGPYGPAYLD